MLNFLRQKQWYRAFFPNTTYYYNGYTWSKEPKKMVTHVEHPKYSVLNCSCGNDLHHSKSLKYSFTRAEAMMEADDVKNLGNDAWTQVWEYQCTNCKKTHYYRPGPKKDSLEPCDYKGEFLEDYLI